MKKHSVGPWKDNGRTTLTPAFVEVVAPAGVVAKVWVGDEFQTDHGEGLANLRLVLNAPELLAVVQELINGHCPWWLGGDCQSCYRKQDCPLIATEALLKKTTSGEADAQEEV